MVLFREIHNRWMIIVKNKWIKSLGCMIVASTLLIGLTACSRRDEVPAYIQNPIVKNLSDRQRKMLADIEGSGIQVIKQGMLFTFVIPTDCFFSRETRMLKSHRDKDLDRLAQFIHEYSQYFAYPRVTIVGHTDKVWLSPARDKLSMHYAETIATFLREDGIDSNIMTVLGRGAKDPIGSNGYPMGASFNRRVVVTVH